MAKAKKQSKKTIIHFSSKLALNQWLLSLFGVSKFEDLALHLRDERLEGLDENNIYRFHHALATYFPDLPELTPSVLLEYDQNIVKHTGNLNERRIAHGEKPIQWKYFQYLSLLFTEIYLDRYFAEPAALRAAIAAQIDKLNEGREEADQIQGFDDSTNATEDLNKLAFWMATGGGKTLIMHANILQYRYYVEKNRKHREFNRIILLTPNAGLSKQHLQDFEASGIEAKIFNKDGGSLFYRVEIIEITKLKDEMGDKTVAVDAFEGNNLVLIDEGHRGAASGEESPWMRYRNALCEKGFSFEYSATFAQAVRGNARLTSLYSRCILSDYSYRFFYNDGFGKDYQILNLDNDTQSQHLEVYLTACLLAFFQQQKLFKSNEGAFRTFHIEKPLWIFVGSSVIAKKQTWNIEDKKVASDIISILKYLARFVADPTGSIARITQVLNQGLVTATGKNLFANRFSFLNTSGMQASAIFDEILSTLFNASSGGLLYVENLKGAQGEIALRIGIGNEPFGVINVGDDVKLVKLCSDNGIETGEREFSGSLFDGIKEADSTVNILIGSKKFIEGWNSWRVSTMGLMNIGATEGAQIIQLFGRGVRLKGYNQTLKRSARTTLPDGMNRPKYIELLETLSIFGIHADYMAQFREFLEEEGLPGDDERLEFFLPVIRNLGTQSLKTIRLKKQINGINTEFGNAFRQLAPVPTLSMPTEYLQKNKVVLNWYPKIQALKSKGMVGGDDNAAPNMTHFQPNHLAFLDIENLYFEIERYKAERGWYNINITREAIQQLLSDQSWYQLCIPASELELGDYEKIYQWQEIAIALLKKYVERYYSYSKREWEMPHLEYSDLSASDPNLLLRETPGDGGYRIHIEDSQEEIVERLNELKAIIESGTLKNWEFRGMKALWFGKHFYQPLLYLEQGFVEISPVPLNKGEKDFVEDLKAFCDNNTEYLSGKEMYLLRNLSKGKGVGFFEAGNFFPDFILWLLVDGKQFVNFIDPKGIRNLEGGFNDRKILFYETIKDIEKRLGNTAVILNSFIISNTPSHETTKLWGISKPEIQNRNVVFQEEDKSTYIRCILDKVNGHI